MPRDGYKPVTVQEATWRGMRDLIEAEETPYDTYDDFVRDVVANADDHFGVLDEGIREAVESGRKTVEEVELDG